MNRRNGIGLEFGMGQEVFMYCLAIDGSGVEE